MHYVAVKSAEHQAHAVAFRTHQRIVCQRTPLINAFRCLDKTGSLLLKDPNLAAIARILADESMIFLPELERLDRE